MYEVKICNQSRGRFSTLAAAGDASQLFYRRVQGFYCTGSPDSHEWVGLRPSDRSNNSIINFYEKKWPDHNCKRTANLLQMYCNCGIDKHLK